MSQIAQTLEIARPHRALRSLGAGLAGLVVTLAQGPAIGPLWYPIVVAASAIPCCWLGGKLAAGARGTAWGATV
ncbi:MAG TPA: hypothetical protein VK509_16500 [Polyangiales bacterium]|nr:hypothetical protein [Polyangiales bacterium]